MGLAHILIKKDLSERGSGKKERGLGGWKMMIKMMWVKIIKNKEMYF